MVRKSFEYRMEGRGEREGYKEGNKGTSSIVGSSTIRGAVRIIRSANNETRKVQIQSSTPWILMDYDVYSMIIM